MEKLFSLFIGMMLGLNLLPGQELLKDINLTSPNGSGPQHLTVVGNTLFFSAYGGPEQSIELWKTDGTTTALVKDIYPGLYASNPKVLTAFQGKLYFAADDGIHGEELWVSDGSEGGTYMLMDIFPGSTDSDLQYLTAGEDFLYFTANDGINGQELWRTNGTPAGTILLKDIYTGGIGSIPAELTMWNDTLFFSAWQIGTGRELWRSEGSTASTRRVRDLYPGTTGSDPRDITVFNDKLAFIAKRNPTSGRALFLTGGDSLSTVHVKAFGSTSFGAHDLIVMNNTLFFWVNGAIVGPGYLGEELWKSDGTFSGTVLVKDINPGASGSIANGASVEKVILYNQLVFVVNDGTNGYKLWVSDGTESGTTMIPNAGPQELVKVGNTVFFQGYSNEHKGLWKSDGTIGGTVPVKDFSLLPPTYNYTGNISEGIAFNGLLFFAANVDGSGVELWRSDGTEAGTVQVTDLLPETAGSIINGFTAAGNFLFFSATDGINGQELWRTDGSAAGTQMVKDIWPGWESSNPSWLTAFNNLLIFVAEEGPGMSWLWKSDGTIAGTGKIHDFSAINYLVVMNGTLYFRGNDGITGLELWRSDGTPEGTMLVKDIGASPTTLADGLCHFNDPVGTGNPITVFNDQLLFCANGELWTSDGTTEGTQLLQDLNPGNSSFPDKFYPMEGRTFFVADNGTNGRELWKTTGLPGGASMVTDFNGLFTGSSYPFGFFDAINWLYLTSWDGYTYEQWVTNGNASGTYPRDNFIANVIPDSPIAESTDGFLFKAEAKNGTTGKELWRGTLAHNSTAWLVKDIRPGAESSSPANLVRAAPSLFFLTADDGATGRELWRSDGTTDGTFLQKDIYEGSTASDPSNLFIWNGALYFAATDYEHGNELWQYVFAPLPVTLLDFTAKKAGRVVNLEWKTGSEHQNKGFELQRLEDAEKWATLDFIPGAGNSLEPVPYHYTDEHPKAGINYYRLRQIDFDGTYTLSKIVTVEMPGLNVIVFPNPGSGDFFIDVPETDDFLVEIYDVTGRLVMHKNMANGERILTLGNVAKGMYILQVKAEGQSDVIKIILE